MMIDPKPNPDPGQILVTDDDRLIATGRVREVVIVLQKAILYLTRYWFLVANLLAILVLGLGFLAPALMSEGLTGPAQSVYRLMATQNHQLPQRSYFIFGESGGIQTYSREALIEQGADPHNIEVFVGNAEIGFKTALNHRMIAIFITILIGGVAWGLAGERPQINRYGLFLMALPLLIDGISHMISDNGGTDFRQVNRWAVNLTGGLFSEAFYQGTTVGTLNWWLRNITGVIFGLGLVWFLYSYVANRFKPIRAKLEPKLRRAGAIQ